MPRSLHLAPWAFVLVITVASLARAEDYDPASSDWNGLSSLVSVANELEIPLVVGQRLDVGTLSPNDALLIVYPTEEMPVPSLAAFMRAGGRIALADDYGEGDDLLALYGIERVESIEADAPRLRGNENLLVAQPTSRHPLTAAVSALVTNHPALLAHDELEPVFGFDGGDRALVLAGAVVEGRLVAIGDPSMLINNMLQFQDNRRFAGNLLRYLSGARGGRVFLIRGEDELVGRFGRPGADRRLGELREWLETFAKAQLPPVALKLCCAVLSAILIVVAITALPRRSPYDGANMFARPPSSGGFVGRVEFFKRRPSDLLAPLMVYKFEIEGEIVRRLGLGDRPLLRDVVEALRSRGLDEREVASFRQLLLELSHLRDRQDIPPAPPRVAEAKFHEMVETGQRILARLEALEDKPEARRTGPTSERPAA